MKSLSTLEYIIKNKWPLKKIKICELTLHYDCNLKCIFCYQEEKNIFKKSLNLKEAIFHLKKSYMDDSNVCQIIGGEPTIYKELFEVILAAKKIGYPIIQIVTNGINLSNYKFIKKLKEFGLNSIVFSIHSVNHQKHDKIVGYNGALKKALKGIENAIKLDIHITIGTAITSLNYKEIYKLIKFFFKRYNIQSYHLIALHIIGKAKKTKNEIIISYSKILPFIKKALKYIEKNNIIPISPILSNFTPCLLPGYEDLISDWKIPISDDDLILPEKQHYNSMYKNINNLLKIKSKKCEACIYSKICSGFEKSYFNHFGDKEFNPLKKLPTPSKIICLYKK